MPQVYVSFTGDTSKLSPAVAEARNSLNMFSTTATGAAAGLTTFNVTLQTATDNANTLSATLRDVAQMAAAVVDIAGSLIARIRDIAVITASTIYVVKELSEAAVGLGGAITSATVAGYEFTDSLTHSAVNETASALDDAAAGFVHYFTEAAYAERSARLFAQANDGIRASIGREILGLKQFTDELTLAYSDLPKTEVAAIAAAGGIQQFIDAVNRVKGTGEVKQTLVDFTSELMKIPGLSEDGAASIEAMFGSIPNYSVSANDIMINLLQTISKTGDDAIANAQKITSAFKDTANGGSILGNVTADLKNLDDVQILATRIAAALNPDQASAYFETIISKLKQQSAAQQVIVDQNVAALQKIPLVGNLMVGVIQDQIDKQREFADAVKIATANLQLQKNTADAITRAQQSEVDYQKVLNSESTQTAKLAETQSNIATLMSRQRKTGSDGDVVPVGDARDLVIRTLIGEAANQGDGGMEAVFAVIKNRVDSAYKGATSYKDVVTAPRQFSTWNAGDPAGAMANAVSPDSSIYKRAAAIVDQGTSDSWSDPTNGATSYYNPKQANPSWGASMTNTTAIGDHVFGNTPDSPPVGAENDADVTQRLQEQYDLRRKINDEIRGGSQADVAALAIAQQNATATKDEVADAEKLLAAKKSDLAATQGGSPAAVLAAQNAVAQAEQSLRDKSVAQAKAAADLKAASAREGSKEQLDATIAGIDAEQVKVAQGSAAWDNFEKQKVETTRKYNEQQVANAVETENAKFDAVQRSFKERQDQLKDDAKVKGLSSAQELAALQVLLSQEEAAEKVHWRAIAALQANNPEEYRKAAQQLSEVDERINQQRVAAARTYNEEIRESYKSTFEQIGSSVASSLTQIIEGTGTFKGLMEAATREILSMVIESNVRMAADWLARQASQVAITTTSEAAKTAAVATGEAARTGLVSEASVIQLAQISTGVIKSILASAAETFAGIFGFLAPVMGPAAVGPAAAGEATVSALATGFYAQGTWALPADQIAQVHRGEMIVPAAATPWAQSLMANAAGSGQGGQQPIHSHTHFHTTAMDSRDVKRFFYSNSKHIMGAVNEGIRSGSYLGFNKFKQA